MIKNKYILGSGLVGLIASYYTGYRVIGDKKGGQFNSKFSLGPRYLHDTRYTRKFLDRFGVRYSSRTIKVGYYLSGKISDTIDDSQRLNYYLKSRGLTLDKLENPNLKPTMSSGKNKFSILEFNMEELIEKLPGIINDRITGINVDRKTMIGSIDNSYKYDNLICTIPLTTFYRLLGVPSSLKFNSIVFILYSNFKIDLKDYDYLYFIDSNMMLNRAAKCGRNIVAETSIRFEEKERWKYSKFGSAIDYGFIKYGHVIGNSTTPTFNGVRFLGRYAEWNHNQRLHNIIEKFERNK